MSESLPRVDFRQIREYGSSQQRAFEELGFVLMPSVENLPLGTRLERRGTPDAGIEFSCPAPDGSGTWAWQAKFLFTLDASAVKQMDRSVTEALNTTPDLVRYAFYLPIDRSGREPVRQGQVAGKSGLQRWNEQVKVWKKRAEDLGREVEFVYLGESDLLKALTREENAGTLRYYFDREVFTGDFFQSQVSRQVANLGNRYLPQMHVELDIAESINTLTLDPDFRDQVRHGIGSVIRARQGLGAQPDEASAEFGPWSTAVRALDTIADLGVSSQDDLMDPESCILQRLMAACSDAREQVDNAQEMANEQLRSGDEQQPDDLLLGLWRCLGVLDGFAERLAPAARPPVLLIVGPAGSGKSHLVADAAAHRADQGHPTLLLLGQQFGPGPAWPQISAQVGRDLTASDLLATFAQAAQVRRSGRALLIIDALNEGPGAEIWKEQLAGLLKETERHPWVAVVLTVRDTYLGAVLPDLSSDTVTTVTHPGFAGHEEEALAVYAEHHGLRLPDFPPLQPEFARPLFLRAFCESIRVRGLDTLPREAPSLSWVFDGLLDAVDDRLSAANRLDYPASAQVVHHAIDILSERMLEDGVEALPLPTARALCDAVHHPSGGYSTSLLHALITEGLLLQELAPGKRGRPQQQVRFTYQRLSDHLRAQALMSCCSTTEEVATQVRGLLTGEQAWRHLGLLEALALVMGERGEVELVDLAEKTVVAGEAEWAIGYLAEHFLNSLVWRSPGSVRDETIALAERLVLRHDRLRSLWLTVTLSVACLPGHPLNSRWREATLRPLSMAERDLTWTAPIGDRWISGEESLRRLINWAWSSKIDDVAPEVAVLAARLMVWLLASPNRMLRDSVTKSMVRLLERHTGVLADLLDDAAAINDPYIVERLVAVAYGHLLRRRHATVDARAVPPLRRIADACATLAGQPIAQHVLIRHYATSSARLAQRLLGGEPPEVDGPSLPDVHQAPMLSAPSHAELAASYGRESSEFLWAVSEVGMDFERYILHSACDQLVLPDQDRLRGERRTRRAAEVDAATRELRRLLVEDNGETASTQLDELIEKRMNPSDGQKDGGRDNQEEARAEEEVLASIRQRIAQLVELRADTGDDTEEDDQEGAGGFPYSPGWVGALLRGESFDSGWREFRSGLSRSAAHALDTLDAALNRLGDDRPVRPDTDVVGRWVAQRVLDLGWTREAFGDIDAFIRADRNRGRGERERFAKKYTWIAFHQVLHELRTCGVQDVGESEVPFTNPWQITGACDIDPSVIARGDATRKTRRRAGGSREPSSWWTRPYQHTLDEGDDHSRWIADPADVPDHNVLLQATDPFGGTWLALETHMTWESRYSSGEGASPVRQQWMRGHSYLIRQIDVSKVKRWAKAQNWMGLWMPTPAQFATGLLGEYPDLGPWPGHLDAKEREEAGVRESRLPPPGWRIVNARGFVCDMAEATAWHGRESEVDHSLTSLTNGLLPSRSLLDVLAATWFAGGTDQHRDYRLGSVETDYSWQSNGELIAFCSANDGNPQRRPWTLWVKAAPLREALTRNSLALWAWTLGEKIFWSSPGEPSPKRLEISGAHLLAPGPLTTWNIDYTNKGPS
ncbi:ATP-binding protein [Nonomuraea sp. NPDC048881]|uniref:ATP-binding protein n=1 Tax=Nonomuraea sp. NPDC048881 TaxID=3155030 RepID=UPI0033C58BAA